MEFESMALICHIKLNRIYIGIFHYTYDLKENGLDSMRDLNLKKN